MRSANSRFLLLNLRTTRFCLRAAFAAGDARDAAGDGRGAAGDAREVAGDGFFETADDGCFFIGAPTGGAFGGGTAGDSLRGGDTCGAVIVTDGCDELGEGNEL
jgi:hypothetical protein